MPLTSFFRRNGHRAAADAAYAAIVTRSREPIFFAEWGVPDTFDGRFEILALHAFLVLNRLKADHDATADYAQTLFDTMFVDLDRGVREMGASDIGVGRHVKAMARGFYGRIVAYEEGLAAVEDGPMQAALRRNMYGTATPEPAQLAAVAAYARRQAAALRLIPAAQLLAGEVPFAPLAPEA